MSTPDKHCKDGASKSNDGDDDDVCEEVNDMLQNMSTADKDVSVCANCGKDNATNTCNKCKMVKYCNAACKKKHRHKHKKQCEEHVRLAAERAAKLHDEKLFKKTPPEEDCPICFLRLPLLESGRRYKACCGKEICSGCVYAPVYDNQGNKVDNEKCPFCRTPTPSSEKEMLKMERKRVEAGDPIAIGKLGSYHRDGRNGFPQYMDRALELWQRAGELGYTKAYTNIGYAFRNGLGVERDIKKATYYWELAAIGGNSQARYNLGVNEEIVGNIERAVKHYMIAVRDGENDSLKQIKEFYSNGHATKEDYTKALQSYQSYLGEVKSPQRDEAAAADDQYRYY